MGYLLLAFAAVYALFWMVGTLLTLRSEPPRNVVVPVIGLVGFLGLTYYVSSGVMAAMDSPHRITLENVSALKEGATPDEARALFGNPADDSKAYDFSAYAISFPESVSSRLRGERRSERSDAKISLKFVGEPSAANLRRGEGLGATAMPADEETPANGLMGAELTLTRGEETEVFREGEHWNYTSNMTPEEIAAAVGEAIDASPSWRSDGSPDSDPTSVIIYPELEDELGSFCNESCSAQVSSGANKAFRIRGASNGEPQSFYGGEEEVFVMIWDEPGKYLDDDFSTANRMVIAGFEKGAFTGLTFVGVETPTTNE